MDFTQYILLAATEAAQTASEPSSDLLGTLGINWKLFIAQLVNFGIVLFIFWKWIVNPLGKTLTARQEKIESGLKNAQYMEIEKQKFEEWKTGEMQKVRSEAEQVMKSATDTAEKLKHDATLNAQQQAEKIIEQARTAIDAEKAAMLKEVHSNVAELVVTASEKILKAKIDSSADKALISESIKGVT